MPRVLRAEVRIVLDPGGEVLYTCPVNLAGPVAMANGDTLEIRFGFNAIGDSLVPLSPQGLQQVLDARPVLPAPDPVPETPLTGRRIRVST